MSNTWKIEKYQEPPPPKRLLACLGVGNVSKIAQRVTLRQEEGSDWGVFRLGGDDRDFELWVYKPEKWDFRGLEGKEVVVIVEKVYPPPPIIRGGAIRVKLYRRRDYSEEGIIFDFPLKVLARRILAYTGGVCGKAYAVADEL